MRLAAFVALSLCCCMSAISSPTKHITDSIPEHVANLDYHIRVSPDAQQFSFKLSWDGGQRSALFSLKRWYGDLDISDCYGEVDYTDGHGTTKYTLTDTYPQTGFSVRLLKAEAGAVLRAGSRFASIEFPISITGGGAIDCEINDKAEVVKHNLQVECGQFRSGRFATEEQLMEYLAESSDAHEGVWEYLDRDAKFDKIDLGGNYRLATVATDSGYDIIYLAGINAPDTSWRPMMVKGRLLNTAFIDNYDLEWYDAAGLPVVGDTSATITGGAILQISFPLHGGTFRFQRKVR